MKKFVFCSGEKKSTTVDTGGVVSKMYLWPESLLTKGRVINRNPTEITD